MNRSVRNIGVGSLLFIAGLFPQLSFAEADMHGNSHFKKVVWIVFENEDASVVGNQVDFARFANYGMSFTNFYGEAHPSQPNYVSMIAGDAMGVRTDLNYNIAGDHVGDLLEKAGLDWHVYAEGFPGKCFTGAARGKYARKHVPFMSFDNVHSNSARCAKITDQSQFFSDLNSGNLPAFSMYIPDLNNDGHDTGIKYAGPWLTKNFAKILSQPDNLKDTLFILTFDESEQNNARNQIYTVMIGSNVQIGTNDQHLNHIALLRMIEDELAIGTLGRGDQSAPEIINVWKN